MAAQPGEQNPHFESCEFVPGEPVFDAPGQPRLYHTLQGLRAPTRKDTLDVLGMGSPEIIDEVVFQDRIQDLLKNPKNEHLRFGLEILAGICATHPGRIAGVEMDGMDGPQAIVLILEQYIREHLLEILDEIESRNTSTNQNLKHFVEHPKHAHAEKHALLVMYLTQLAHMAFYIAYFGYTPSTQLDLPHPIETQSAVILTMYGSLITASPTNAGHIDIKYHRLSIRDNDAYHRPLTVHSGKIPFLQTKEGGCVNVKPYQIGRYQGFSQNLVIGIKAGPPTDRENTHISASLTTMSQIIRMEDLRRALGEPNEDQSSSGSLVRPARRPEQP